MSKKTFMEGVDSFRTFGTLSLVKKFKDIILLLFFIKMRLAKEELFIAGACFVDVPQQQMYI